MTQTSVKSAIQAEHDSIGEGVFVDADGQPVDAVVDLRVDPCPDCDEGEVEMTGRRCMETGTYEVRCGSCGFHDY